MVNYNGTAFITRDYVVMADDVDQAKDFIFDLADEEFPSADAIIIKDIYEVK